MSAPTMNPAPERVTWSPVARVNLLPPEIDAGRRFRRVQRVLAAVVVLNVLLLGVAWYSEAGVVSGAQDELDSTQGRSAVLQKQQALYAEVPRVTAQLAAAQAARASALGRDVLWNRVLDDVVRARPAGLRVTTVALAAAPVVAKSTSTDVGTMTITGTATGFTQVPVWILALAQVSGLSNVQLVAAAAAPDAQGAGAVSFTVSVTVTADALSKRYDEKAS